MEYFPTHLLYARILVARTEKKYVRQYSLVCVPVFQHEIAPTVEQVVNRFGPSFSAYLLELPAALQQKAVNRATLEMLLNVVHFIVHQNYIDEVDQAYEQNIASKANHLPARDFLDSFSSIKVNGEIQAIVNDMVSSFLHNRGNDTSGSPGCGIFKCQTSLIKPNMPSNDLLGGGGMYFLQLFSHGYVSMETVANFRIRGPICFARDLLTTVDDRLVGADGDIYQWFSESLRHYIRAPHNMESSYPWLRVYLARCLEKIYWQTHRDGMNVVNSGDLEEIKRYISTNSSEEKSKLKALIEGIFSTPTAVSDIMQLNLAIFDAVPASTVKRGYLPLLHYSRNLSSNAPTLTTGYKRTRIEQLDSKVIESEDPLVENLCLETNNFVEEDAIDGGGFDEHILSEDTRQRNRYAYLLSQSKELETKRSRPNLLSKINSKICEFNQKKKDSNPLQFRKHHSQRKDGMLLMQPYPGDGLSSTDFESSNIFNSHELPKRRRVMLDDAKSQVVDEFCNDEADILAGDERQKLPNVELMQLLKELASEKIGRQNNSGTAIHILERKYSSSALIAMGIVAEEISREMMISWYKRGSILPYSTKNVLKETMAQTNGCPVMHEVTDDLLTNRLKVLFGHKVSQDKQKINQLMGYLKRSGKRYPLSNEVAGSASDIHQTVTVVESSSTYGLSDALGCQNIPNYPLLHGNLSISTQEIKDSELPEHIKRNFHTGSLTLMNSNRCK